jgi:hypothetical protein
VGDTPGSSYKLANVQPLVPLYYSVTAVNQNLLGQAQ